MNDVNLPLTEHESSRLMALRTENKRLREALSQSQHNETRLSLVLKGANDGWWDWDFVTGERFYSARGWAMLGFGETEIPYDGQLWERLIHADDRPHVDMAFAKAIKDGSDLYAAEMRLRHKAGHYLHVLSRGHILRDENGRAIRLSGTNTDLTERKTVEENIHRLGFYDPLTNLPNRRLMMDRLTHALLATQRSGITGAVMFLDLDNFKQINDARGHRIGDALLMQVAERISQSLRSEDTVARIGGDEFVVLVEDLGADLAHAALSAMAVAEKIRATMGKPYLIEGSEYNSSGSIGITVFPRAKETVEDLLREADTAMYRAKSDGRNRIVFFETGMQAEVEQRLAMENDLAEAIVAKRLRVDVQPQVDEKGHVVGGELLLRWNDPVRGPVSPMQFIPLAEESGQIVALGDWVLEQACEALVVLHRLDPTLSLSVNVSPRQFRQEQFVAKVQSVLQRTGANPQRLIMEVTEGLLIANLNDTVARMDSLVNLGIRFSIDDFGTGYSSLAYLKKLPLYELKIDKSFVQDTPDDPSDTAIVQSIIAMAGHLGLQVVAEGVETPAQANFLKESHCKCMQGYLFSRPLPLNAWIEQLQAHALR